MALTDKLAAIADAIRESGGTSAKLTPAEMPAAIAKLDIEGLVNGTLTEYSNDAHTFIRWGFLAYNFGLTGVSLPNVTELGGYAIYQARALTSVYMPKVEVIGASCFRYDLALARIDLPQATSVGSLCFANCRALATVILRRGEAASLLAVDGLTDTPIAKGTGYVYVPEALVDDYKAATNWSVYAAQFRAIEDYPEICDQ